MALLSCLDYSCVQMIPMCTACLIVLRDEGMDSHQGWISHQLTIIIIYPIMCGTLIHGWDSTWFPRFHALSKATNVIVGDGKNIQP